MTPFYTEDLSALTFGYVSVGDSRTSSPWILRDDYVEMIAEWGCASVVHMLSTLQALASISSTKTNQQIKRNKAAEGHGVQNDKRSSDMFPY